MKKVAVRPTLYEILFCFMKSSSEVEYELKAEKTKEEKEAEEEKKIDQELLISHLGQVLFLFMCQGLLTILVGQSILHPDEDSEAKGWKTVTPQLWIVFARFICGIVLHVFLSAELKQGLTMMKYAVNHSWKFDNYWIAFMSGFL